MVEELQLPLRFSRGDQRLEVDFVVPAPGGGIDPCEAKTTVTSRIEDTKSMQRLRDAIGDRVRQCLLVLRPSSRSPRSTVLAPGMAAVDLAVRLTRLE